MEKKPWYRSKTLQGQIIALIGLAVDWLNLPVLQDEVQSIVSAVFLLVGLVFGIYGRVVSRGEKLTK